MEDYIKVSGKTVEEALMEASIQLGTSSDNIEYRIIEKETKGFLGIGAKKAVIEARKKSPDEDIIGDIFSQKKPLKDTSKPVSEKKKSAPKTEKTEKSDRKTADKQEKASDKLQKTAEKAAEKAAKVSEKAEKAAKISEKTERAAEKTISSAPVKEKMKAVSSVQKSEENTSVPEEEKHEETSARVPADPQEAKRRAEEFLTSMIAAMGTEATVTTEFKDGNLNVNLEGDDMGILIGKRGQTLDSIQYLTSLVVNRGKASYVRVKVDTENYRERRKATLENLAKNMAFKVKKTRRPAYLEPMNPYERRIIHSALQNDAYVTTHSEGEEPCRKVVITLKKRERNFQDSTDNFDTEE